MVHYLRGVLLLDKEIVQKQGCIRRFCEGVFLVKLVDEWWGMVFCEAVCC